MKTPSQVLEAASGAPDKDPLTPHLGAVVKLREKGYSWREIADFLAGHGVTADHTRIFRLYTKYMSQTANVPDASMYAKGLKAIRLSASQRKMLELHYRAHNRTVTYTELAAAAGSDSHRVANSAYGKLGLALGEATGYTFPIAASRGEPFYSGALGIDAPRSARNEYRLMMHHELAKAIEQLGWFQS